MTQLTSTLLRSTIALGMLALAACAPAPIYKPSPATVATAPNIVAQSPDRYANADVIWGGTVVQVSNFPDRSEVEIVGYPLDSSQRPKLDNNGGWGRFVAVMPGFVEPFNYPTGALITLSGRITGTRPGNVGQATYVFPTVSVAQSHVWTPAEMEAGKSNVSFGIGVGGVIH
ncbi:Slp family lipoprotein [Dyella kyungheensis]|jgi:outer membrane lipoprotein|uniref:Slp family lipoprotein n=1 Tax=Dyella kyungheensis TaxID=1242174 RepID=A0ABS2JM32_9GAMM|nr:Slp family lipoprotein [Dyella kyungheensis]MBM7119840.1 Slp family lipoprotein [Dyella kyungheensis]